MRGALVLALLGCGRIAFDPAPLRDSATGIDASCSDAVKNGDETGIDCGGSCTALCPGATCGGDADCVTGRCEGTCELWDLAWQAGPSLIAPRYDHACVTRSDGTVVVIGGKVAGNVVTGEVEILVSGSSTFTAGVKLGLARSAHGASITADGRIVVMGGIDTNGVTQSSVEIYSGGSIWSAGPPMLMTHSSISATLASNGRIYVPDFGASSVYDPQSNMWGLIAEVPRDQYGVASDGDRVFVVAGGMAGKTNNVDAYDVSTQSWIPRAPSAVVRDDLAAVRAPDGRIYAIGGADPTTIGIAIVEAYTPARDRWRTMPSLGQARANLCATLADDGRIIAIGGATMTTMPAATELYGPMFALDVEMAPPGASVGLMASGFAPNATLALLFDGVLVATATTNANGNTGASFVVPARPSGAYRVTAIDQRSQYPVTRSLQIP